MTDTDLSGQTLGQYRLLQKLGEGGMGAVYRAEQARVGRRVAVKVLPPENRQRSPDFLARFEREAQILGSLTHPHILPLYDFGESGAIAYLVMPLMNGGSLAGRLRTAGAVRLAPALELFEPLAQALDHAHAHQVLHRDLKPSNVLFDNDDRPALADFGIARLLTEGQTFTETGATLGTPAYMSPEQARGDRLDARSDIYAFGVMVYEALTGGLPFEAETPMGVSVKHITEPPRPPRQLKPDLPDAVENVLLAALSKSPDDRYRTAAAFVQALRMTAAADDFLLLPAQSVSRDDPTTSGSPVVPAPPAETGLVCGFCGAELKTRGPCPVCGSTRVTGKPTARKK